MSNSSKTNRDRGTSRFRSVRRSRQNPSPSPSRSPSRSPVPKPNQTRKQQAYSTTAATGASPTPSRARGVPPPNIPSSRRAASKSRSPRPKGRQSGPAKSPTASKPSKLTLKNTSNVLNGSNGANGSSRSKVPKSSKTPTPSKVSKKSAQSPTGSKFRPKYANDARHSTVSNASNGSASSGASSLASPKRPLGAKSRMSSSAAGNPGKHKKKPSMYSAMNMAQYSTLKKGFLSDLYDTDTDRESARNSIQSAVPSNINPILYNNASSTSSGAGGGGGSKQLNAPPAQKPGLSAVNSNYSTYSNYSNASRNSGDFGMGGGVGVRLKKYDIFALDETVLVRVNGSNRDPSSTAEDYEKGRILFIGTVEGTTGIYFGVGLEEPHGNHDGTHKGVRYFHCAANHGLLVKMKSLQKLNAPNHLKKASTVHGNGLFGSSSKNDANASKTTTRPTKSNSDANALDRKRESRNGVHVHYHSKRLSNASDADSRRSRSRAGRSPSPNLGSSSHTHMRSSSRPDALRSAAVAAQIAMTRSGSNRARNRKRNGTDGQADVPSARLRKLKGTARSGSDLTSLLGNNQDQRHSAFKGKTPLGTPYARYLDARGMEPRNGSKVGLHLSQLSRSSDTMDDRERRGRRSGTLHQSPARTQAISLKGGGDTGGFAGFRQKSMTDREESTNALRNELLDIKFAEYNEIEQRVEEFKNENKSLEAELQELNQELERLKDTNMNIMNVKTEYEISAETKVTELKDKIQELFKTSKKKDDVIVRYRADIKRKALELKKLEKTQEGLVQVIRYGGKQKRELIDKLKDGVQKKEEQAKLLEKLFETMRSKGNEKGNSYDDVIGEMVFGKDGMRKDKNAISKRKGEKKNDFIGSLIAMSQKGRNGMQLDGDEREWNVETWLFEKGDFALHVM